MGDFRGSHEVRYRNDLSNQQILDLRAKEGMTDLRVAIILDCSEDLVRRVRLGLRKDPTLPSAPRIPKDRLCRCCQSRRIAPGNRYLCQHCFERHNEPVFDLPAWATP